MQFSSLLVLLLSGYVLGDCGQRRSLEARESPDGHSQPGEWPWHVAVWRRVEAADDPKYVQAGTIISERFVVTVRSAELGEAGKVVIRVGAVQLDDVRDSVQQVYVEEILRHPDLESDIALLKTVQEFRFGNFVKPLCLWSGSKAEELIVGKDAISPSWVHDGSNQNFLRSAELVVISRKKCQHSDAGFYTKQLAEKKRFCGEVRNGSLGSNGAGLYVADKDGKWSLRGIVDPQRLQLKNYPLFVDVAYYAPWIREQIGDATNPDYSKCGQKSEHDEGRPWPWQGQVYRNDSGSIHRLTSVAIISELFLISPAGVYSSSEIRDPKQLMLTFTSHENDRSQVFHSQRIGKIIRHENFYPESGSNNIALLQLRTPLKFSELLRPICLWRADPRDANIDLGRSGTGFTPVTDDSCDGPQNSFCIETTAPIAWNDTFYLEKGDSWYLKGITVNMSMDEHGSRAVLLDVPRYTDWIDENTVFRRKNLLGNLDCAKRFINDYTYISDATGKKCFAAHIKPSILLTTATCLKDATAEELSGTSANQTSMVKSIHVHPRFNASNHANNIAIVELEQPLDSIPFCIHLDTPKRKFRLRSLLPTRGFEKYFYDLSPVEMSYCAEKWRREGVDLDTSGGHLCGEFKGIGEDRGQGFCEEQFQGCSLYHDYGDGKGVYLRGLMDLDKRDHCEQPELPEVYVDVTFYAEWIRDIVGTFREDS